MPQNPLNIMRYREIIYMRNNKLSEKSITSLVEQTNIYRVDLKPWDTERFVDGMNREEVESAIEMEVKYAKEKYEKKNN